MIKDQLQADLKSALKAGDADKRLTVSMALSAIKNRELEKRAALSKSISDTAALEEQSQLTDEEAIQVIASEIKKRKEAAATYEQAGRGELAQKEQKEASILSEYLPEQMTPDELKKVIDDTITEINPQEPKDIGKVIGAVMAKVKGRAGGQTVSLLIKESLGKIGS